MRQQGVSLRYVRGEEMTEEKKEPTLRETLNIIVAGIFVLTLLAIAPAVVIAVWRELL